jgi:hypothetical protein
MKKASDVFKAIRFAKSEPRGKAHKSTDDEGHYTVGEKEFNQQLQHVKKRAMMEAVKDKFDIGEYDQEGDMAKSDLRSILANAKRVHDMLEDSDNLPEWVQSKITKAEDYMSTVANYMEAEMNEETEIQESGGPVLYKKGDDHIEKYGEDSFALYKNGKKAKYYTSLEAAKEAMNEEVKAVTVKHKTSGKELVVTPEKAKQLKPQGYHPVKEDVVQEGRPSQRHPLEGHDYHKKTNAELEYIAKDAHKAAEAMKSHNTTAENKYRDQANDSATVRHFRKTSGSPDWYKKKYGLKEDVEQIDEKNVPTSPEKWSQAKAQAKAKFDVYPSAYANGWAAKKYKEMGGGWKSVSEETKPPFEGPYTKVTGTVTDKSGAKHTPMSRVRDIARMAMKKQVEKMKKPVKEEASMKSKIVKDVMKKKKEKVTDDSFQKDPIISKSEVKM